MKKFRSFMTVFYYLTIIVSFLVNIPLHRSDAVMMTVVAAFTPLLLPLAFRIFHIQLTDETMILNLVFLYFASIIGSCFGGYSTAYFDKVVHFFSGILAAQVSMIVYGLIRHRAFPEEATEKTLYLLFIQTMSMSIALIWEFYEYLVLIGMNNDAIRHYTTGVHDSITDMIAGSLGALLVIGFIYHSFKNKKSNFFIDLTENFLAFNQRGKN